MFFLHPLFTLLLLFPQPLNFSVNKKFHSVFCMQSYRRIISQLCLSHRNLSSAYFGIPGSSLTPCFSAPASPRGKGPNLFSPRTRPLPNSSSGAWFKVFGPNHMRPFFYSTRYRFFILCEHKLQLQTFGIIYSEKWL